MDTISVYRAMSIYIADASICDTNGKLLFYTNGLTIGNRNYDTLSNSVNFNPGGATDFYEPIGLGICQPLLILPDPGNSKRYYLFHESGEFFTAYDTYELQPLHLSYSIIDMNIDGGLGGIVDSEKNKYIIIDTLLNGGLTAVKHANGRDWWIICHRFYNDKYYKLLLTPYGIEGPFEQQVGSNLMYDVVVEANFSPDGSKYCISNHLGWFDLFDFDRCTGEFFNLKTIYNSDSTGFFGSSFSPNGRFLYVSTLTNLYQYDTWDSNMVTDVVHIASWDTFYGGGPAVLFFMHQLAPDGKIYISGWNGTIYLNVIEDPDSLGTLCNFKPHSLELSYPEYNNNLPSFPNYDLGTLEDSPCDTLFLANNISPPLQLFRIYPNPVGDWLNIVYQTDQVELLELFDIYGNKVLALSLYPYFKNRLLNVSALPSGVYEARVTEKSKMVWSGKVVVQH